MLLPPPLPAPVALAQLLADPSSSHTHDLTHAEAARARTRTALKATRNDPQAADWAGAARAVAEYLPHLYAILACVEADDLLLRTDPVFFAWRASLSSQALKKASKRVLLPSLHAELTATLLSYALCLANQASSLVTSLGSYEIASSVTTTGLKGHDETVNQAADTLCRASGVLMHLAEVIIPRWEAAVGLDALRARPVEMSREVTTALAKMCLADANLLAIRRLLSRSLQVAHSTTTPGPPLPPSHPSPALLAKLHLQVFTLYDEARAAAKTVSSSSSSSSSGAGAGATGSGDLSPALRRYLSDGRTLALALSYKWLGVDAGERGETGDALGFLGMAGAELEALAGKDKGLRALKGFGKARVGGKARKGKVGEEVESTEAFRNAYRRVNDSVHFHPVPSPQTLQSRLPSGRAALALKPFPPPSPAFRPRSTGAPPPSRIPPPPPTAAFAAMALGGPGAGGAAAVGGDSSGEEDEGGDEALGSYFGAGQYF